MIPTEQSIVESTELDRNLMYLRVKAIKCPLCQTNPIVIGGYSPNKKSIYYQIECCGNKTGLQAFNNVLNCWIDLFK